MYLLFFLYFIQIIWRSLILNSNNNKLNLFALSQMFSPPVAGQGIKNGTTNMDSMYSGGYKPGKYFPYWVNLKSELKSSTGFALCILNCDSPLYGMQTGRSLTMSMVHSVHIAYKF